MSSELYEVLSLAARYLFTLLGIIIVLRAFFWLLSEGAETRRRLRRLPDAGMIGEMLVLHGGAGLEEGAAIPVPWEGVLGSVRSCDITVPCDGVRPSHLSFSYQVGLGLIIRPMSGCEVAVDSVLLDCRSDAKAHPMVHGSFLQVGQALLRLRVFAGLESNAGFSDPPVVSPGAFLPGSEGFPAGQAPESPPIASSGYFFPGPEDFPAGQAPETPPIGSSGYFFPGPEGFPAGQAPESLPIASQVDFLPGAEGFPAGQAPEALAPLSDNPGTAEDELPLPDEGMYAPPVTVPDSARMQPEAPVRFSSSARRYRRPDGSDLQHQANPGASEPSSSSDGDRDPSLNQSQPGTARRRRSDRWEADWSE